MDFKKRNDAFFVKNGKKEKGFLFFTTDIHLKVSMCITLFSQNRQKEKDVRQSRKTAMLIFKNGTKKVRL